MHLWLAGTGSNLIINDPYLCVKVEFLYLFVSIECSTCNFHKDGEWN